MKKQTLHQIMLWVWQTRVEYATSEIMDIARIAYRRYHEVDTPTANAAEAQIQADAAHDAVPYYVEWFIRKEIYPLFVIQGGKQETATISKMK